MPGRNDETDLVAVHVDHLQPLFLHRQLGQSEIGDVLHHRLHHARPIGAVDQKLDRREQALVFGEDLRQDVDAGSFVGGDHQLSARVPIQLVDGILRTAAEVQHLLGVFAEDLARGGKRDAAAKPLEKRRPQLLLQLAHLGADGRLRKVAGLSGFGKALQPDDFEERMQLVKIHRAQTKYESAG